MYEHTKHNALKQLPLEWQDKWPHLDNYEKPANMVNESLYDNTWWFSEDNPEKPDRKVDWEFPIYDYVTEKITYLTDPDEEGLLAVAQIFCLELQNGNITGITTAQQQTEMMRSLFTLFAWMRLNCYHRIDQLTPQLMKKYLEASVWGRANVLEVDRRLDEYILQLKKDGRGFPTKRHRSVDKIWMGGILADLGLAPTNQWGGTFLHDLYRTAREELNEDIYFHKHQKIRATEVPEVKPIGKGTLSGRAVLVWQLLYDMGNRLPQQLPFNPATSYVVGKTLTCKEIAAMVLKGINIEEYEGITETIPDLQAFYLIDRALRWVLLYSDDLIKLRRMAQNAPDKFELVDRNKARELAFSEILDNFKPSFAEDSPGAPWPLDPKISRANKKPGHLPLGFATGHLLMAACAIVIAAFTARRRDEVRGIRGGEPTDEDKAPRAIFRDKQGEPWLWCWIEKTYRTWDRVPIPEVVVKAVEVLEALTADTRKKSKSRNLFELQWLDSERIHKIDVMKYINDFADFVEVPPLEDGTKWIFKPHQFRRFFSLLFFYRFNHGKHGKLEVLSHHLRHRCLEMTKRYVEERHESDMLKHHRENMTVDLLSEMVRNERDPMGPAGDDLKKQLVEMVKEVRKNSEVLSEKTPPAVARKIAERVMDKLGIDMIPFIWGYCVAYRSDSDDFKGNCVKGDCRTTGPDLAKATPNVCFSCKHQYVDENFRPWWEIKAQQNQGFIDRGKLSEPLGTFAEDNVTVAQKGLSYWFDNNSNEVQP